MTLRSAVLLRIVPFVCVLSGLSILFGHSAAAYGATLSGTVKDNAGAAVAAADVEVIDTSQQIVATAATDAAGAYSVSIDPGTYDVRVAPPPASGFSPSIVLGQAVAGDTTVHFVLVPAGGATVSFRGRVTDASGAGLPNQTIGVYSLATFSFFEQTTDAGGNYAFQIPPGDCYLQVSGFNDPAANLAAPRYYSVGTDRSFSVTQHTSMDIALPVRSVSVHVQEPSGAPSAGVALNTDFNFSYDVSLGPIPASGTSYYPTYSPAVTDADGNATLWLFTNTAYYSFVATPPAGSAFVVTRGAATVLDDVSVTITLAEPVTFSGRVTDVAGAGLPNQWVSLGGVSQATDPAGNFVLRVAPGDHYLSVSGEIDPASGFAAPRSYSVGTNGTIPITNDTVMDVTVPAQRVTVHVQEPSGAPAANVVLTTGVNYNPDMLLGTLSAWGSSTYPMPAETDAEGNATVWLFASPANSPYAFVATPPAGSSFGSTNQAVTVVGDTSVTLTLAVPVTFSGQLTDGLGAPLPNQSISLNAVGGGGSQQTTDATGRYSFKVGPGDYRVGIGGYNAPGANVAAPLSYGIVMEVSFPITQDTVMDFALPVRRVSVRVQDSTGTPVANVALTTDTNYTYPLELGGFLASGNSVYSFYEPPVVTDAGGNATLWLFPSPFAYFLTATPPAGSRFATVVVRDLAVASDVTLAIVLERTGPPQTNACPLGHGFWKNHAEFWPVDGLRLGSETYTRTELESLLRAPVRADASIKLGHQLIAAKLNVETGSKPDAISEALATADAWLAAYPGKLPYGVKPSSAKGQQAVAPAALLDAYNNGALTTDCNPLASTLALTQAERDVHTLRMKVDGLAKRGKLTRERSGKLNAILAGAQSNARGGKATRADAQAFTFELRELIGTGAIDRAEAEDLLKTAILLYVR